ncbi:MAG: hypothetical protein N3B11_07805 [Coriobacteriia bacterium]|nr:hypothetical protein [Coriobacteriia bacterium]
MALRRVHAALLVASLLTLLSGCVEHGVGDVPANPNELSSGDLVERMREYDGMTVVFTGEAIGEAMVRGDGAWIHLNDDAYYEKNIEEGAPLGGQNSGMPVWVSATLAKKIRVFGDYKHEGDVVRVKGVFHDACAEHGGDTDIHAESLEVVRSGHAVVDEPKPRKLALAIGLSLLAATLFVVERKTAGGLKS